MNYTKNLYEWARTIKEKQGFGRRAYISSGDSAEVTLWKKHLVSQYVKIEILTWSNHSNENKEAAKLWPLVPSALQTCYPVNKSDFKIKIIIYLRRLF